MKKTLTLISFALLLAQGAIAQFTTSGDCAAFMIVGTTFTDSGGAGGDYASSESASCTFCPDNPGEFMVIDFTAVDNETCCDILSLRDSGGCLFGAVMTPTTVTATTTSPDGCITVNWSSDGSIQGSGWEATVSTTTTGADPAAFICQTPPPPCGTNDAPTNTCDPVTDLDLSGPFCGTTDGTYTADTPGDLGLEFCGNIDNNSFLAFEVAADPVVINFWVEGCNSGPQFQFFTVSDPCDATLATWTTVPMDYTLVNEDGVSETDDEADCINGTQYGDGTQGTITLDGVTPGQTIYLVIDGYAGDVCDYVFEGESGVVPAELTALDGTINAAVNTISWTTASESNTAWFVVERSLDGKDNWGEMGRVAAAGESIQAINYSFDDVKPVSVAYYRLVTVDLDGSTTNSPILVITRKQKALEVVRIAPMPTTDILEVTYQSFQAETVHITLLDMLGNTVEEATVEVNHRTQTTQLDLSAQKAGMYLLTLDNGITKTIERVIKQ